MVNLVIKDFTGQAYELTGRSGSARSSSAKRYSSDSYSTFRFVATLPLAPDQWVQILKSTHQHLPNFHSSHPAEVHHAVAQSLMRGDLTIYQLPALNANGSLQGKNNFGLCIVKGPNPHSATSMVPEVITGSDAAKQLLDNLGISPQAFLGYLTHENLYDTSQKKGALNEAFKLLASGELLAYKLPLPPKAPPAKAVEYVAATAADRSVPLAPESNNSAASSNTKKPEKIDAAPVEVAAQSDNNRSEPIYEKPTIDEVALAKSEGSSDLHIQAREKVSRHFLESNGFSESQIATAIGDEAAGIDGGVDLAKPVEIMSFPPPEEMAQYVKSHGFPGNWFDPASNQTPDALGLNGEGRTLTLFKVPTSQGLLSHSKPIVDDWTNPSNPVSTAGGGKQLFVNDATKKAVISLNKIGM